MVTIAIWQCAPTVRDQASNLSRLESAAREARASGATLLVAPELVLTGYDIGELDPGEGADAAHQLARVAASTGTALVVGVATPRADGGHDNSSLVIDGDGTLLAQYRKSHLFADVDRSRFTAGDAPFAIVDLLGLKVATMICYDVEFPESVRAAALAGAHLLAVPTANMEPFRVIGDVVIPCRAWENQIFVAYANHCGAEGTTRYVGASLIAGPDGTILARAGQAEEILVAEISAETVSAAQRDNPYLADRRPELYHALAAIPTESEQEVRDG
ncbi:MAG: carbon-nitrogen hydrolase family protein [Micrococcales bacterium]|nr:carbon-nitrogen hydrolase family protein [Micrococcales bacterium]